MVFLSRMSSLEAPMRISNSPGSTVRFMLLSSSSRCEGVISKLTLFVSPGLERHALEAPRTDS